LKRETNAALEPQKFVRWRGHGSTKDREGKSTSKYSSAPTHVQGKACPNPSHRSRGGVQAKQGGKKSPEAMVNVLPEKGESSPGHRNREKEERNKAGRLETYHRVLKKQEGSVISRFRRVGAPNPAHGLVKRKKGEDNRRTPTACPTWKRHQGTLSK